MKPDTARPIWTPSALLLRWPLWLPLLAFAVAAVVLHSFRFGGAHQAPLLLTALNTLFNGAIALAVAFLAARTFAVTGARSILALGCGALFFAAISLLTGPLIMRPNTALTLFNVGILLSGICFLLSGIWAGEKHTDHRPHPLMLPWLYLAVAGSVVLLLIAAGAGVTPAFWTPAEGGTSLRLLVLSLAALAFAAAGARYLCISLRFDAPHLQWLSLGLLLIGMGVAIIILGPLGTPLNWLGRVAQYAGSVYLLVAIIAAVQETGALALPLRTALRRSEERLELALSAAGTGVFEADMKTGEMRWDERTRELWGVSPDVVVDYEMFIGSIHTADLESVLDALTRVLDRPDGEFGTEYRIVRLNDHAERWVLAQGNVTFQNGRPVRLLGTVQDITERKRHEEALRSERERMDAILSGISDVCVGLDAHWRIAFLNLEAERFYRRPREELIGRHFWEEFPETRGSRFERECRHVMEERRSVRFEEVSRIRPGKVFAIQVLPTRDGIAFFASDMTEQRKAEQEREQLAEKLQQEHEILELVFEKGEAGLAYLDRDFIYRYVNSHFGEALGVSHEQLIGSTPFDQPDMDGLRPVFEHVRDTGEAVVRHETLSVTGGERGRRATFWDWRLEAHCDEHGDVAGLVLSMLDVTDRVKRSRLEAGLHEIDMLIHSTLKPREILPRLVDEAGRSIDAAASAIHLRTDEGGWRVAHVWALDQGIVGQEYAEGDLPLVTSAYASRSPVVAEDFQELKEHARMPWREGFRSGVFLPLIARDSVLGVLSMLWRDPRPGLAPYELDFARKLSASASYALENARLFEEQRLIARTLQEQLIHSLPEVEGLELSAISRPASAPELIGGDFHDVFQLPDGQVALLIGDVEGKGVRAAGTTETVRSAVRALVMISPSPRYVLNNVNRLLLQEQNEQFVTALLLIMDPATGLTYVSSAGHPPPVRIATGETAVVELEPGPPLGTFASEYPVRSLRLAPGERLMLYTDGVTEARAHGELFGEARLVAAVERFRRLDDSELVNNVLATVEGYADELRDDIQIVLVGIGMATTLSADAPSLLHLTIPMAPWRLADVRGSLRDFLRLHEVDEETSRDVILCVEEASSNAIRHGGREEPAELLVSVTRDHVEAEVSDSGRGFRLEDVDVSTAPDLLDEGGRGLFLIHALGEDVQIETDSGTRVRFRKQRRIVHPDRRLAEGPAV